MSLIGLEEQIRQKCGQEERIEMAKNMLAEGFEIQVISEVTGLTETQIQTIQKH